eukprot:m.750245 g.750245  ORF g.750245 m.750245 type:complete len:65 (-) comp58979_c0_seq8:2038-2232(-)
MPPWSDEACSCCILHRTDLEVCPPPRSPLNRKNLAANCARLSFGVQHLVAGVWRAANVPTPSGP